MNHDAHALPQKRDARPQKHHALPLVESPQAVGFDEGGIEQAFAVIDRFCSQGQIPGGVAIVGRPDAILKPRHFGHRAIVPHPEPNSTETIYDCASLTKVVITAPLIWCLIDRGMLRLDDPVAMFLPAFASPAAPPAPAAPARLSASAASAAPATPAEPATPTASATSAAPARQSASATSAAPATPAEPATPTTSTKSAAAATLAASASSAEPATPAEPTAPALSTALSAPATPSKSEDVRSQITIRQLLTHTSGLPAWTPLYQEGTGWDPIVQAVCRTPLEYPPGTRVVYSCLGYIILGEIIRRVTGKPLETIASEWILTPLGMHETFYNPPARYRERIAPTECEGDIPLRGVVHDENARAMGGISGNAGLFSTATDLARFASMLLSGGKFGGYGGGSEGSATPVRVLSSAVISESIRNHTAHLDQARGLGWVVKAHDTYSSAGDLLSPESFGHTGFTGTSLWCDPKRDLFIVLLTNSVHPTRDNVAHRRLRPLFHNAVVAALKD